MTPPEQADERLKCMEVRGGFRAINQHFNTTGTEIWLFSRPQQSDHAGGDVYYISSCASGRITRLVLADISGHGAQLTPFSQALRTLMRANINRISSRRLMSQLNREVEATYAQERFATSLIATYFCPTRSFTLNIAGHPTPLLLPAGEKTWRPFHTAPAKAQRGLRNLPLGVHETTDYDTHTSTRHHGDILLFYTDGLIEAQTQQGTMLGEAGLIELLNSRALTTPHTLIPDLLAAVTESTGDTLAQDDLTLLVCQIQPARITLKDNLLAPWRFLRGLFQPSEKSPPEIASP